MKRFQRLIAFLLSPLRGLGSDGASPYWPRRLLVSLGRLVPFLLRLFRLGLRLHHLFLLDHLLYRWLWLYLWRRSGRRGRGRRQKLDHRHLAGLRGRAVVAQNLHSDRNHGTKNCDTCDETNRDPVALKKSRFLIVIP